MVLNRTPFHPQYEEHGAKVFAFAGWDMPVQFEGIVAEHQAVRTSVGMFDVSHMGNLLISGRDSGRWLQGLLTNDLSRLEAGRAQYTLMCYPEGGTLDDVIVYCYGEEDWHVVCNAANTSKVYDWLQKHRDGDVFIEDATASYAQLALQGPQAMAMISSLCGERVQHLQKFRFIPEIEIAGIMVMIARTGYTGEDGVEIYVGSEQAAALWRHLFAAGTKYGIKPIGLGARDTLRFEAGFPLYGHELSAEISPLSAGLERFVKLDKGSFIGSEELRRQHDIGLQRRLIGVQMEERSVPQPGDEVFFDELSCGRVTSGSYMPTLRKSGAMALLDADKAVAGQLVTVQIRGKGRAGKLVELPFYRREV